MIVCGKEIRVEGRLIRTGRLEADGYEYLDDPQRAIDALRASRTRMDLFTFKQKLSETSPKYAYPMEWDNVAALPVSTFDHWWSRQLNDKTRNMVRRAEKKGVSTREVPFDDTLVNFIFELYNEAPIRQGKVFPHHGKDVEVVRKMSATFLDRSVFIGAFFGEQLIGFAKLVSDDGHGQAALMHILSMVAHRDKAPTNALIAEAVRACVSREIPYLVYSKFAYGKKQRDSLSDFKQHNGFRRIDVPRYYVPLTLIGSAMLRLGLHHSLTDHIPERLRARIRRIRSLWYARRPQASQRPI